MAEEIKAHITGVVFQVTAKVGDKVAAGDPVIVLESMKMEIPVEAPRAGAVKEIRVRDRQSGSPERHGRFPARRRHRQRRVADDGHPHVDDDG